MITLPSCIETFRQGWMKEDIELIKKAITPDMIYVDPFGTYEGADAMIKYCVASFRRFRDYSMEITRLAQTGNVVGLEWSFKLTGDVGPIAGKRVELVGAGMLELRDGRIRSWHDYWDSRQMAKQLEIGDVHELRG
jgi:limonene-1,2-epoxide hydrolase